jgi:hypothetical protein
MPPREVFVNTASHVTHGEEIVVTTTKGATKTGTRQASWSVTGARSNLGADPAQLVTASPAVEVLPMTPGSRSFRNHVKLPPTGGDRFTVTVRKAHESSKVSSARSLPPVELEAWRKLYVTFNCMAGLEGQAAALAADLPAMFLPAFIRIEVLSPQDTTPMQAVERIEADDIADLVAALPDEPYARRLPTDAAVQGLWIRLALVKSVFGFGEDAVRDVGATDAVHAAPVWRITKQAPPSFVYAPEGSVEKLELVLTGAIDVDDTPTFVADTKKSSGSTTTTFTVTVDQPDIAAAVRAVQATLRHDVALHLVWPDGRDERLKATAFDDPVVTFSWNTGGQGNAEKTRWAGADQLVTTAVEVKARHTIAFAADGQAAEGTATPAADGDTYVIAVTDVPWVARLSDYFAGRLPGATLKVHEKAYKKLAGHSGGANIAIAVSEMTSRASNHAGNAHKMVLRAIVHEIIHSIGGVSQDLNDGSTHPKFYAPALGGSGTGSLGHCATGATLTDASTLQNNTDEQKKKTFEPNKARIYLPSSPSICLMYHRAYVPHFFNATLCAHCVKQLRLLELDAASLPDLSHATNY